MIDLEFLKSLGIKENFLPKPLNPHEAWHNKPVAMPPRTAKLAESPRTFEIHDTELRQTIWRKDNPNNVYVFEIPGYVIYGIYPDEAEVGLDEVEAAKDDFMAVLEQHKPRGNMVLGWKSKDGSTWYCRRYQPPQREKPSRVEDQGDSSGKEVKE